MSVLTSIISCAPVHTVASSFLRCTHRCRAEEISMEHGERRFQQPRGLGCHDAEYRWFFSFKWKILILKWRFKNCNDLQRRMLRPKLTCGRNRDGSVIYCYLLAWRRYPFPWTRHGATPEDWSPAPNTLQNSSDWQITGRCADFPAVLLEGSFGSCSFTGLKAKSLPSSIVGCNWASSVASNAEILYREFFTASCCSLGIRAVRTKWKRE